MTLRLKDRNVHRSVLALIGFILVCAGPVHAQVSTGGIRGIVRDATGGVLPGVTVEAASPARIGGAAVSASDGEGMYRLENLPVGIYTVTFTLTGFTPVKHEDVRVEAGRSIELDQTLALSAVQETLTVRGESPVVDTVHAGTTTNFNRELIDNVPATRDSFFDLIAFAPAVKAQSTRFGSSGSFSIYGSATEQSAYQYNGVDVSSGGGGPFDWPNYDMMQEVQVQAVGASAEYAGFQGGVVNIITKSGSNTLKGSASFYGVWNSLLANNLPDEPFPLSIDHRYDMNFAIGGPIKKDRLWVQYINQNIRHQETQPGIDPALAATVRIWRPFIKVDARLSDTDNLALHFNDSRDWWPYGADQTRPISAQHVEAGYDPVFTGRWTHTFGSSTMLEARGGGVYVRKDYIPYSGDYDTPGHFDLATGNYSANNGTARNTHQNNTNVHVSLAHTADDFVKGTHEFKFGVQVWNRLAAARQGWAGDIFFYDFAGAPYYALIRDPSVVGARVRTTGGFVQDNWTVTDRVAVNLGVRYDRTLGDVPALEQLNARLEQTGKTFDAVPNLITFSDISPRLGMTVKLDQVGKTVLKGSWGRYHGKLVQGMFQNVSPGGTVANYFFYNAVTRRYDIPYYSINARANYGINPDLTNQYTDQAFIGLERELWPNFGINVSFIYKREDNFIRLRDVAGVYVPQPYVDTFRDQTQTLTVYNRVSPSAQSLFQVTNRDDFKGSFKTFLVEANKRWSERWQALISYQWQRALGFASGAVSNQSFGNLSAGGFGRDPNDLTNAYGRMGLDSEQSFRISTTYEAPFGIHLGVKYSYDTGRPHGRLVTVRGLRQGSRNVLAEPRGAYQMPANNDLRVRFDKDVNVGSSRRLRLSLDVINLFNTATPIFLRNNSTQANFGQYITIMDPRKAQVGIRFEF